MGGGSQHRAWAGSVVAFAYNGLIGRLPSRLLRQLYLRLWLGAMGPGTGVQLGCRFLNARKVELGARNVINFGTLIDGRRYRVVTGADVSIGPEAAILTLGHDPQSPEFELRGGDVRIGDRAWIGYRAMVLPGVTIGEGAVIGAGAVVTGDVEPYAVMAGNPARQIGTRATDLAYALDYRPWLQ
jgi:acetyltransferase-like isoleucine patch superfamily enzyme